MAWESAHHLDTDDATVCHGASIWMESALVAGLGTRGWKEDSGAEPMGHRLRDACNDNRSLEEELEISYLGGSKDRTRDVVVALTILAILFTLLGAGLLLELRGPRVTEPGVNQGVLYGVPRDGKANQVDEAGRASSARDD